MCRAAAEADRRRLGDATGARHTHQWWAGRSRHTQADAARLTALGRALEDDLHARTARALADGALRVEQARVIVEAAEAIPAKVRTPDGEIRAVDPAVRDKARDHLLVAAAEHDAKALRRLGKRILDVVAPELGEAQEAAALAAEEDRAHAAAELVLVDDGSGRCHGRFTVPSHVGAMLGSRSRPLDLGRAARLYTKAQRIALGQRDGGCTARGCETTASGCHAHHDDPWSRHGRTDLDNGRLLCPLHATTAWPTTPAVS